MATQRQTRTGGRVQPVYEDFKPVSTLSQDDDSYILTLQVPGFTRGQLKVTAEEKNVIRVRGGRLVAGNQWSRFLEDFKVPDNAQLTSVRAKHQGDNLVITVPKKNKPTQQQPPSPKPQYQLLPPKTTPMADKGSSEILRQQKDEQKQRGPEKPAAQQTGKKILDDKPFDLLEGTKKTENLEKRGAQEAKHKLFTPEKTQLHQDHHANIKESEKQQQSVNDEERQLLVNVGAALLVIVALSAYVSYNFATRSPP